MKRKILIIVALVCVFSAAQAEEMKAAEKTEKAVEQSQAAKAEKKPSKGLLFFYRTGRWIDNYLTRGIDTSYIALPEHSWRLAYTNAMVGVHSTMSSSFNVIIPGSSGPEEMSFSLLNRTTPSVDLGFYAGYRGFGFGYSWDALNAYAQRLSFSFGSKFIGIDFSIQTSTNITTRIILDNQYNWDQGKTNIVITNASLNIWYALNAAHYSHQAAVKQSYIQKKTAGSLLVHLAYQSSQVDLQDTVKIPDGERPLIPSIMSNVTAVRTRQIAIGIGYGINYTPNKGKVVLHASAAAMLVTYSVNLISYYFPDTIASELPSNPMFNLEPATPVHVTGNMRAAVSWEINKWVHLNAWATGEHIRFRSKPTAHENVMSLRNWNWKVQASVGVRFGAGKDRLQRALEAPQPPEGGEVRGLEVRGLEEKGLEVRGVTEKEVKKSRIPKWITGYFWSPKY